MFNLSNIINVTFAIVLALGIVLIICKKWKIALILAATVFVLFSLLILFYASQIPTGDMVEESNAFCDKFETFVESNKGMIQNEYYRIGCRTNRRRITVTLLFYNEVKIPEEYIDELRRIKKEMGITKKVALMSYNVKTPEELGRRSYLADGYEYFNTVIK